MNPTRAMLLALLLGALATAPARAAELDVPGNGQVRGAGAAAEIYSEAAGAWVSPEAFWLAVAKQTRGRFWGRRADYPPYADVDEHDTLLVELEQGSCLMYFFHSRWRRAQDVRRWDAKQNGLAGCPHVFD